MQDEVTIPDDLQACQTLIVELAKTVEEMSDKYREATQENAELKLTINELLRQAFRKRSERYLQDPDQLRLDFGGTPEAADAAEGLHDAIAQAETIVAEHTPTAA